MPKEEWGEQREKRGKKETQRKGGSRTSIDIKGLS